MENKKMLTYNLKKYFKNSADNRVAKLVLEVSYGGIIENSKILTINVQDEDIQHIIDKYVLSNIEETEIEFTETLKKLNSLKEGLDMLKSI